MVMGGGKLDLAVDNKNRFPKAIGIPIPDIYIYTHNRYSKDKSKLCGSKIAFVRLAVQ